MLYFYFDLFTKGKSEFQAHVLKAIKYVSR